MNLRPILLTTAATLALLSAPAFATTSMLAWQTWQDSHFTQAKKEQRFILLDLEAVWCHWCHVMEQKTYSDPRVTALIAKHYIPVKVDQDARPDLGKRYEDYGWPATIVFDAEGNEIVKLRGYIAPARMASILEAIVKDPSPIHYFDHLRDNPTEISRQAALSMENREELTGRLYRTHDFNMGGLNQDQKFMDRDSVELALTLGHAGDKRAADAGWRAQSHRPGVGRCLAILDRRRLESSSFRENHVGASRLSASLRERMAIHKRSALSRCRKGDSTIYKNFPHQSRRCFLREPGRRPGAG